MDENKKLARFCAGLVIISITGVIVASAAYFIASIISNIPH